MQLKFKNKKFRIMQVSDPQDLQFTRRSMIRMLNDAYDKYKPDLVLLTGDNILGNHLCDARIGTKLVIKDKAGEFEALKTAIDKLVSHIEKRKIPFGMIYGNHDDRNRMTKKEQADIYRTYSCNVGLDCPESGDEATYNIPIYDETGEKILFNIWMLDSAGHDKEKDQCYEFVKPEAIEWYKSKSKILTEANDGKPVPSLMVQHIPMIEILQLIEECSSNEKGAIEGPDKKFFKLKKDVKGHLGEYPSVVSQKNGQMDAIKQCGDVKAVVFGHDHNNCFEGEVDGVKFIQTACSSFRCYGGWNRGVRLFDVKEDGSFITKFCDYREICGKGLLKKIAFVIDADGMTKERIALALSGVGLVGVLIALLILFI